MDDITPRKGLRNLDYAAIFPCQLIPTHVLWLLVWDLFYIYILGGLGRTRSASIVLAAQTLFYPSLPFLIKQTSPTISAKHFLFHFLLYLP